MIEVTTEISDTKRKFLESLEIDINNLSETFKKFNNSYKKNVRKKEDSFLFWETPRFTSRFCMRDIVGTLHTDYENMKFFESFVATKRGDDIVEMYNNNPSYYNDILKQQDQTSQKCKHDTPIELYRAEEGKHYAIGGNNRINLMMMLYLYDLSKAKTEEEKNRVYKKHTYYAAVKAIPKNKKIVNVISLLKDTYDDIAFKFAGNSPDDCIYNVTIDGKNYHVDNYDQLYNLFKRAYSLSNVKDKSNLMELLDRLFYMLNIKVYGDKEDLDLINGIYSNLDELKKICIKAKQYNIFDQINYSNLDYDNLLGQLKNKIVVAESNLKKRKLTRLKIILLIVKIFGKLFLEWMI